MKACLRLLHCHRSNKGPLTDKVFAEYSFTTVEQHIISPPHFVIRRYEIFMAAKNVSYERAVKDSSVGVKCRGTPQTVPSVCCFHTSVIETATVAVAHQIKSYKKSELKKSFQINKKKKAEAAIKWIQKWGRKTALAGLALDAEHLQSLCDINDCSIVVTSHWLQ